MLWCSIVQRPEVLLSSRNKSQIFCQGKGRRNYSHLEISGSQTFLLILAPPLLLLPEVSGAIRCSMMYTGLFLFLHFSFSIQFSTDCSVSYTFIHLLSSFQHFVVLLLFRSHDLLGKRRKIMYMFSPPFLTGTL